MRRYGADRVAPGLGDRRCGVRSGRSTFDRDRCRQPSVEGGGPRRCWGLYRLRGPARGVEPSREDVLQHSPDLDPLAECRGVDAPGKVLAAGPGRGALGRRPDPGPGSGSVAVPAQLGDHRVEPQALDELHGIEADIAVLAHLVDWHDVGVVQSGRGARLAAEPLPDHAVAGHRPGQGLQRHPSAQRDLLGLVHHAHAAPADLAEDAVVADLPREWTRGPGAPVRPRLVALQAALGLLHLDHRREEVADLIGQVRVAIGVFLERGAFAAAEPGREFLG